MDPVELDLRGDAADRWERFVGALRRMYPEEPSVVAALLGFSADHPSLTNDHAPSGAPEAPARRYDGPPMARPIRLTEEQREIFDRALARLRRDLPDELSEGRAVELLAAEFLGGA